MSTLKTNNIQHVDRSEPSILIDTSGSVSIAGTLTYEDVTNVDSVGIITARGLNIFGNTTGLQVASGISTFQAVTGTTGTFSAAVSGTTGTFSDNVQLNADTKFLQIGASQDLDLHHNGTNSYIRNKTGDLHIRPLVAEEGIILKPNAAVELYHNNGKKFETSGGGGTLTGDFTVTGNIYGGNHITILDSDGSSDMLKIGASEDLRIYHYNNNTYIRQHTDLPLIIGGTTTGQSVYIQPKSGEDSAIFKPNGAVELYHDNERKLYTKANGIQVEDTTAAGAYLVIATSGGSQGSLYGASDTLGFLDSQNHYMLKGVKNGAVELYHDNSKRIQSSTTGMSVTRQNAGEYFNVNANYGSSGDQAIETSGDLTFYTNGSSIAARLDQDGLKFNADTAAANALDDYEEGTFTPTPGEGTVSLGNGGAKYTKIGRVVFVQFDINYSGGTTSNSAHFALPLGNASVYGSGSVGWTNRGYPLFVHVSANAFAIMDNSSSAGSSSQHATYTELNGTRFIGDFRYFLA